MALNRSLSEILARLQQQIDSLREQVGLHARQEEHHRDQRALFEAELQKALGQFESLQAAAGTAAELDLPVVNVSYTGLPDETCYARPAVLLLRAADAAR